MSVTISTTPVYPTRSAKLSFALSGGGDYVKLFVTDAPYGSALKKQLDDTEASRRLIFEGDSDSTFTLEVDKGGKYVVTAQEITKGATAYGGAYSTDPNGYATESIVGENSTTIVFGSLIEAPLGAGADVARLRLWAWADTVRATTAALHGTVTPAVVEASSAKAVAAASSTGVASALAALAGTSSSAAIGTLKTVFEDIRSEFNDHCVEAGVHNSNDLDNLTDTDDLNANGPGLIEATARLLRSMRRHMTNDAAGAGPSTSNYHTTIDSEDLPVIAAPGSIEQLTLALADAWRAYEAHRQNATRHPNADTNNTLVALPKLLDVQRAFLVEVADPSPTAPATVNEFLSAALAAGLQEG